ncbi:MAG: hypothetical protein ABIE70_02215 [bacterium]
MLITVLYHHLVLRLESVRPILGVMELAIATYDQAPDLFAERDRLVHEAFPEFAMHSAIIDEYFWALYEAYPDYQFGLHHGGKLVAIGNCMPVAFDGPLTSLPPGGVEWGLQNAAELASRTRTPGAPASNTTPPHSNNINSQTSGELASTKDRLSLCAFQIVIDHAQRHRGVSYQAIKAMVNIARAHDLMALIAPVRPNRKPEYPLMPMDEYVAWKRADGLPVDDWLRVHVRLKAEVLHICERSFVVEGTVAQWEKWTGRRFESSGEHVVQGALNPVTVDLERDHGIYVEPNVWVVHRV